jgi:hypothetical protein
VNESVEVAAEGRIALLLTVEDRIASSDFASGD